MFRTIASLYKKENLNKNIRKYLRTIRKGGEKENK